jgi:hypothetical protein
VADLQRPGLARLRQLDETSAAMTHEVMVPCNCENISFCRMELYVSDVRVAAAEIVFLQAMLDAVLEQSDAF